jgi:hypothetical protein
MGYWYIFDALPPTSCYILMPPPPESGIQGVQSEILSCRKYNLQSLKMSDILKHAPLLNKNTRLDPAGGYSPHRLDQWSNGVGLDQ